MKGQAAPPVSLSFAVLALSVVVSCALFSARTPAETAAALIQDANTAREAAAQACSLYRAGVALGEVTPDAAVTQACDEAYPAGVAP